MDKILGQLIDLLLGAVPTMVILVFLYAFLRIVFFNPLDKLLKERHDATEGREAEAQRSIAAAEAKAREYDRAFETARGEIVKMREGTRQAAVAARAAMVEKARAAAAEKLGAAHNAIDADVMAARTQLGSQSQQLAESITEAILR
jgi:F-type H+-transporting ATPase subunit b